MTNLSRLDVIRLFAFSMLLLLFPATSWAQPRPPLAEQMAKTYGLDSVRANRGHPLHLHCGTSWWRQTFSLLGMEPKDRHGLLPGER